VLFTNFIHVLENPEVGYKVIRLGVFACFVIKVIRLASIRILKNVSVVFIGNGICLIKMQSLYIVSQRATFVKI